MGASIAALMKRRAFVTCLGAVLAVPRATEAQQTAKIARIGLLSGGTDPSAPLAPQWRAFFEAMNALGWIDGQDMVVERRFAGGDAERVLRFAAELAQLSLDVIVATGLPENQAIRRARVTIPVVMVVVDDPVGSGFVQSLARPGGNFTGVAFSVSGVGEKYVELLKQAAPSLTRVAIIASNPQRTAFLEEIKTAARVLGLTVSPPTLVREPAGLEPAFARVAREHTVGLVVPSDAFTFVHRQTVVTLAAKYRLPAIYMFKEHVEVGGLMAYGPSIPDRFRQAATFVDKILKGAKPGDLPVEQPTKFELVINLKAANALGLTIPPSLLLRADHVIE
jgi:putative tryptophan/tyrosine transport system substrate-binding protein